MYLLLGRLLQSGKHPPLFVLDRYRRIHPSRPSGLPDQGEQGDTAGDEQGDSKQPPGYTGFMGEVLQVFVDAEPGDRSGYDESDSQ